ncbi:homocysteine/selenocysteine methylase (S-methylmethionine-dependent) [alpha proteobacterium HIMB114]|nr:homocysteine/selenocysteine methylase (S-methylmethionine-dependent) [alpha proteobacterium HIMB114]
MKNIFTKNFIILDGGMGQELLARGVKPVSNLWSATALMEKKYHQIIKDCHLDFINAGAEIILTNTFGSRRRRLEDNQIENRFEELNFTALKLAKESVKESGRKVLIAGSLPPQNFTYLPELGDIDKMKKNFFDQAKILNEGVDLFYLDVLSSSEEIEIGIQSIQTFNKPFVVGIHFKKNGLLPSGEKIKNVINKIKSYNPLAITGSCVAYEDVIDAKNGFIESGLPFGFKVNAFKEIPKGWKPDSSNPNLALGKNEDLTAFKFQEISKEFIDMGAKLIGGCCEITPSHISKIQDLR